MEERHFKRLKVEQSSSSFSVNPSPISDGRNVLDLECPKLGLAKRKQTVAYHPSAINQDSNPSPISCYSNVLDGESEPVHTCFDKYSEKEKSEHHNAGTKNLDSAIHEDPSSASNDTVAPDLECPELDPAERTQILEFNPLDDRDVLDLTCHTLDVAERKQTVENDPSAILKVSNPSPINVLDLDCLKLDPAERKQIAEFPPNMRDQVRSYYIKKGPFQPSDYDFPRTMISGNMRQFQRAWFIGPYCEWLEYSIKADAAFCLCCYLFKNEIEAHGKGGDCFTKNGFKSWNKAMERLRTHVGDVNSIHNRCYIKMLDFPNQSQSIVTCVDQHTEQAKICSEPCLEQLTC